MANACDSLSRVTEGELAPGHELYLLAVEIDEILLARGTREATEGLLGEHGLLLVVVAALAHEEVVQVLQLSFKKLQGLLCLSLVSELLSKSRNNVVKTVHKGLFELLKVGAVCLQVELILNLFHPLGELVT